MGAAAAAGAAPAATGRHDDQIALPADPLEPQRKGAGDDEERRPHGRGEGGFQCSVSQNPRSEEDERRRCRRNQEDAQERGHRRFHVAGCAGGGHGFENDDRQDDPGGQHRKHVKGVSSRLCREEDSPCSGDSGMEAFEDG